METWWEVNDWGTPTITPVEVLSTTEHTIILAGVARANARRRKADVYFPTWEKAHAHILELTKSRLESARRSLQDAQGKYGNVVGMRNPENADDE